MTDRANKIELARAFVEQAAVKDDLDGALAILMTEAEIHSGDVAGQFFSEFDDEHHHWQSLGITERTALLNRYLDLEVVYFASYFMMATT